MERIAGSSPSCDQRRPPGTEELASSSPSSDIELRVRETCSLSLVFTAFVLSLSWQMIVSHTKMAACCGKKALLFLPRCMLAP
jgi:hypothetical protein